MSTPFCANCCAASRRSQQSISRSENPGLKFSISARLLASLQQVSAAAEADLEYLDREPAFHLRFNPRQMTMDQARQTLTSAGIPFRELPQLDCFETTAAGQVLEKPEQLAGFYVQNTGSQAVALLAAATAEKTVCDVAAAPGGKSQTLACLRPDIKIWASDVNPQRLRLLEQNIRRLHLDTIFPFVADIFKYPPGREAADLIILDAPCTSSGTLRKNPDLKSKISKEMIEKNSRQQRLMLASLVERFPHARWLYAVCSFIHEEGESGGGKSCRQPRPAGGGHSAAAGKIRFQDKTGEIRMLFIAFRTEQRFVLYFLVRA